MNDRYFLKIDQHSPVVHSVCALDKTICGELIALKIFTRVNEIKFP